MKKVIFGTYEFLAPVIFWSIFLDLMDQKMARAKNFLSLKTSFFMPINHAKEFSKSIHTEALFLQLFARVSTSVR